MKGYHRRATAFAIHADRVARRLWPGLLPPPPRFYREEEPETVCLARWGQRFTRGLQVLRGKRA